MYHRIVLLSCCLVFGFALAAQTDQPPNRLVQFSGLTLDGSNQQLEPVPYVNILVKSKNRGTYSDFEGFFSIVLEMGDTVIFSAIGYETINYVVPTDLEDDRYSIVQLMTQNAIDLPETVVFPWPSREHFKLEFLAMDVTSDVQERVSRNLAAESLEQLREAVPRDGMENANYYLRRQARQTYYIGQQPPMNIFSPVAWGKFFKAWKNGDFKRGDDR
jgi:hypothetical protein